MKKRRQPYPLKPFSVRKLERKSKNRLIITLIIVIFISYSLITWVLPSLINGLTVVNKLKKSNQSTNPKVESVSLAPPVLNIPYEATNTAVIKVTGYALPNSEVELYLDDQKVSSTKTSSDGTFSAENINLLLGINNISGRTVDEEGNPSLPSKIIRVTLDNEKPTLEVSQPQDDSVVQGGDKKITISGSTESGSQVWINELRVIVNNEGHFSHTTELKEGENIFAVKAVDSAGNPNSLTKKVTYQP